MCFCLFVDHRVGAPERRDPNSDQEQDRQPQILRVAQPDALLLRPQADRRPPAALHPDGQRQVQLRLRVSGRAGQAGADAADRPLLPDHDAGAGGPAGRIALRSVVHLDGAPVGPYKVIHLVRSAIASLKLYKKVLIMISRDQNCDTA